MSWRSQETWLFTDNRRNTRQCSYRGCLASIGLSLKPGSHDGQVQTPPCSKCVTCYASFDYASGLPAFPVGRCTNPTPSFPKKSLRRWYLEYCGIWRVPRKSDCEPLTIDNLSVILASFIKQRNNGGRENIDRTFNTGNTRIWNYREKTFISI